MRTVQALDGQQVLVAVMHQAAAWAMRAWLATAAAWLHGRLIGQRGHRPCAQHRSGLYTCVIRYHGGVRRIYWNPRHRERVHLPAHATYRRAAEGRMQKVGRHNAIRIGYRPVMVRSPR